MSQMQESGTGLTITTPGAPRASESQQAQFDMMLGRCRQVLGEMGPALLQIIQADPVRGVVKIGTKVLHEQATGAQQAGAQVDPTVLLNVGVQLVKDMAGIASEAGIVPDEQLEAYLHQVMQMAVAEYLRADTDAGLLSQKDREAAQAILAQGQGQDQGGDVFSRLQGGAQ